MSDFFQNGVITTLHVLHQRPVEALEEELSGYAKHRPMALILPSMYSELKGPALPNIEETSGTVWGMHWESADVKPWRFMIAISQPMTGTCPPDCFILSPIRLSVLNSARGTIHALPTTVWAAG